ncbi:MAG TPA: nitroreductase [Kofleriaceae bacterium]
MNDRISFLTQRRSAGTLVAPGPSREQLDHILGAAGAVPDHGNLRPYRFAVIEGDGRAAFGQALADTAAERRPDMPVAKLEGTKAKAFRSPTIIAVIASPKPGKIETWEQVVTASCAGYALVLAAYALGVGAVWKSVPFTKGKALAQLFGMNDQEEMLGWIHLGTAEQEEASPRAPLDVSSVTTLIDGNGASPYRPA